MGDGPLAIRGPLPGSRGAGLELLRALGLHVTGRAQSTWKPFANNGEPSRVLMRLFGPGPSPPLGAELGPGESTADLRPQTVNDRHPQAAAPTSPPSQDATLCSVGTLNDLTALLHV